MICNIWCYVDGAVFGALNILIILVIWCLIKGNKKQ